MAKKAHIRGSLFPLLITWSGHDQRQKLLNKEKEEQNKAFTPLSPHSLLLEPNVLLMKSLLSHKLFYKVYVLLNYYANILFYILNILFIVVHCFFPFINVCLHTHRQAADLQQKLNRRHFKNSQEIKINELTEVCPTSL